MTYPLLILVFLTLLASTASGTSNSLSPRASTADDGFTGGLLSKRDPCDGNGARFILYKDYYETDCPALWHEDPYGDCEKWLEKPVDRGCAQFCQLHTRFEWGLEAPFDRTDCHGPGDCQLSETNSASVSFSGSISPKYGKMLKGGVSGGFSYGWAWSTGLSRKVTLEKYQCGYWTFIPVKKIVWGTSTVGELRALNEWSWYCINKATTKNFRAESAWMVGGSLDGAVIFVYMDCLTREPSGPEMQDPIYNMPGVPMPRTAIQALSASWVVSSCDITSLSSSPDQIISIRGRGFRDDKLGVNGSNLQAGVAACGAAFTGAFFLWMQDDPTYEWHFGGWLSGAKSKACIGQALVAVGGLGPGNCK